ncbi:hypothetical protein LCGC14_2872440, partial [marine sediment metagenome]
ATLAWNACGSFVDRWVPLRTDGGKCVFLAAGETMMLPIAHGEGKFVPRDEQVLDRIRDKAQAALRYDGDNPNGSVDDIAGICDPSGRVFGLMPHPERFVDVTQHPTWTRGGVEQTDGLKLFQRAAAYFA